jgi:hypothetical protein
MMVGCKIQSLQPFTKYGLCPIGGFMTVAKNRSVLQPLVIDVSNIDINLSPAQLDRLQSNNPDLQLELTECRD